MELKKFKWHMLVSSVVTLLPMLFGIIVFDKLPEKMETHWGITGTANGWSSPLTVVLFMPLLLLAIHLGCIFLTNVIEKGNSQNKKMYNVIFFIMPVLSLTTNGMIYATAFGIEINVVMVLCLVLGIAFVIIGNYIPKCTQSRTMGIKLKWTLANEANWNATHRFGGRVWVAGGFLLLLSAWWPMKVSMALALSITLLMVLLPLFYSWDYSKKQIASGEVTAADFKNWGTKTDKRAALIATVMVSIVLIFCAVLMFTGDVSLSCGEEAFTLDSTYWEALEIPYEEIDGIEYREGNLPDERTYGFSSARLLVGGFKNGELGVYTRYTYRGSDAYVVLRAGGRVVVFSGKTPEETKALYDVIVEKASAEGSVAE